MHVFLTVSMVLQEKKFSRNGKSHYTHNVSNIARTSLISWTFFFLRKLEVACRERKLGQGVGEGLAVVIHDLWSSGINT